MSHIGLDRYRAGARYPILSVAAMPSFRVSPVTENAFVLLKITAPSDLFLDVVRLINVLTYLFTYLPILGCTNFLY